MKGLFDGMKTYQEKRGVIGGAVRAVSTVFPENYLLRTSRYRIVSGKIPAAFDGFRIVQISDLHGCRFGKENRRLLAKIDAEKPDLVVMTGDIADRRTKDYEPIYRFAKTLCGEYPVYFVYGNHEQELSCLKRRTFLDGLRGQGVRILDNETERLKRGGEAVALCGTRIPLRYYRWNRHGKSRPALCAEEMERLLGECGPEYTILLAHNPLFFEAYAFWGADLTLSGHIHGGMICLPHFGGLLSPERSFFPRYSAGLFRIGERCMAVSRGLGRGPRVNNRPEIVSLILCRTPSRGNEGTPRERMNYDAGKNEKTCPSIGTR